MSKYRFTASVHDSGREMGGLYLMLDETVHTTMGIEKNSRVLLHLGDKAYHRALQLSRNGYNLIVLNRKMAKDHGIRVGAELEIVLEEDQSEFGMGFPEEFAEVLEQDPEGKDLFHRLSPGLQRGFLYYISSAKGVQTRVNRSLHVMTRLRELKAEGKIK